MCFVSCCVLPLRATVQWFYNVHNVKMTRLLKTYGTLMEVKRFIYLILIETFINTGKIQWEEL